MRKGYCKLFISASMSIDDLQSMARNAVHGSLDRYGVVTCAWGEIDIRHNDEYSSRLSSQEGGFLYFKYIADVEAKDDLSDFGAYIGGVRQLLQIMKRNGITVVAACDFEDQLA